MTSMTSPSGGQPKNSIYGPFGNEYTDNKGAYLCKGYGIQVNRVDFILIPPIKK